MCSASTGFESPGKRANTNDRYYSVMFLAYWTSKAALTCYTFTMRQDMSKLAGKLILETLPQTSISTGVPTQRGVGNKIRVRGNTRT